MLTAMKKWQTKNTKYVVAYRPTHRVVFICPQKLHLMGQLKECKYIFLPLS